MSLSSILKLLKLFISDKWKKILFWVIVLIAFIGGGLYLKFAGFGAMLMALAFFAGGCVCGWFGKIFYEKFIAPVVKKEE